MKALFQILLSLTAFSGFCQYTSIPDPNFEQHLINMGVDDSIDGQVLTDSISGIETLILLNSDISSLGGIQDFSALKLFTLSNSPLINSVDLSQNFILEKLKINNSGINSINLYGLDSLIEVDLSHNLNLISLEFLQNISLKKVQTDGTPLSYFDLSGAPNLTNLLCDSMQMISLDLSANPELYALRFLYTPMRYLDLSHNSDLVNLFCPYNDLRCLNIRGTSMYLLNTEMNPNLTCIEVNDTNYAISNWSSDVSPGTSFSMNCNNSCTNAVNELEMKEVNLVRIINLLGQEVKAEYNSVQIHEYSDGSTKKVFNLKY